MAELRGTAPLPTDDPEWVALLAAMESVDQRGETYELDDLADEWESIWSHPETDATFVWDGPELVGFVWLKAMLGERSAHKVSCWGGVRPSHRRRGIGSQLFEWMVQRATEVAAGFAGDLPAKVETDAADHQVDVAALARRFDFEPVRRFLEVARPTADPVPERPAVGGLEMVPWSADLDEEARLAHMEAFADHWGSEPRSREAWEQWYTGHRSFRPDLSVLAVEPISRQVVSLVLTAAYPQDWELLPVEAWINTVGTRRSWRGKGVARWLTAEVLRRIATSETGFERTILGVDAESPTGALRLYRDLGFHDDVRAVTTLSRPPR
ncbi:MAG: GNAT family N-acetyltransferase [Acidimicrobiales bacterium]